MVPSSGTNSARELIEFARDRAFLDETLEDGRTVLEHLDAFATDWETLPKGPHGLANYGENGNLLECAPAYIHCVPSLNAQNVWMMRRVAQWHAFHGDAARAKELQDKAASILPAVIALYKPSAGVWNAYHMDGSLVELRHCVDFIYVGDALCSDLTATQKAETIAFVKRENAQEQNADQAAESLISNIYLENVQSGEIRQITSFTNGRAETPHWSPDGNNLAFNTVLDGRMEVQIADIASGEIQALTREPACCPAWMRK
jgi:hypothetical protein